MFRRYSESQTSSSLFTIPCRHFPGQVVPNKAAFSSCHCLCFHNRSFCRPCRAPQIHVTFGHRQHLGELDNLFHWVPSLSFSLKTSEISNTRPVLSAGRQSVLSTFLVFVPDICSAFPTLLGEFYSVPGTGRQPGTKYISWFLTFAPYVCSESRRHL